MPCANSSSAKSQHAGDVATPTGHTTGLIKNCKVGDCVSSLAPTARLPARRSSSKPRKKTASRCRSAREEIETARKNRGADWGVFVFSKKTAPAGLEPFSALRQRFRRRLGRGGPRERRLLQSRRHRRPRPLLPHRTPIGRPAGRFRSDRQSDPRNRKTRRQPRRGPQVGRDDPIVERENSRPRPHRPRSTRKASSKSSARK